MTNENIIRLRISSQKALIGKITEEVRGVYVNVYNTCINLYVIIDGDISEYWSEAIYEIGTEIVSDFDDFIINEKLIRIDFPNSILSFKDEICVYRRYECQGNTKQNIKEVKNQNENIITVITR